MTTYEPEGCGWSYDHDLRLLDERDGVRSYLCRVCDAEVIEDDEEEE